MADFQERITLSADTGYSFSLFSELQEFGLHTDIILFSDGRSVAVHSAIMSNCSDLMCNLLTSIESKLIILPGFSTILFEFMTLVYTGHAALSSSIQTRRNIHANSVNQSSNKGRILLPMSWMSMDWIRKRRIIGRTCRGKLLNVKLVKPNSSERGILLLISKLCIWFRIWLTVICVMPSSNIARA